MVAVKENTVNLPKDEFRKMTSHNFKKGFCGCSTKTGTLLIGWSHFILCFVLFVIMTASAIYGTIELQEYLMKAEDDNLLSTETSTDAEQLTTLNYSDEKAQTTTSSHETDKNKTWQEYLDAEKKDRDYYYKLYDDDLEKYPMIVPRWRREVGDETIGDGTAGDGTAGDGTAGDGTAGDGTTSNETIGDETIGDETIGDETIGDGPISDEKVGNGKIVDESMDDVDSLSGKTKDIEDKSLEGFIDELSRENHEMLLLEAVNKELNEYGIYIAPSSKGFESSFGKSPTIKEFGVDDGELSSAGDLETKSTMDEDLDGYLNDKPSDEPTVESTTSEKSTDNVDSTLEESKDSGEFRPFHGYGGYRAKDEIREISIQMDKEYKARKLLAEGTSTSEKSRDDKVGPNYDNLPSIFEYDGYRTKEQLLDQLSQIDEEIARRYPGIYKEPSFKDYKDSFETSAIDKDSSYTDDLVSKSSNHTLTRKDYIIDEPLLSINNESTEEITDESTKKSITDEFDWMDLKKADKKLSLDVDNHGSESSTKKLINGNFASEFPLLTEDSIVESTEELTDGNLSKADEKQVLGNPESESSMKKVENGYFTDEFPSTTDKSASDEFDEEVDLPFRSWVRNSPSLQREKLADGYVKFWNSQMAFIVPTMKKRKNKDLEPTTTKGENDDDALESSTRSDDYHETSTSYGGADGYESSTHGVDELTNNGGDDYELAMEGDYDELPTHEVNDELTNGGGADFDVQSTKGLDHEYESSTTFNGITESNEESSSMEPSNDDDIIYEVQDVVPYNPVEYVVYGVLSALRGGSILFSKILGTIFGVAAIFHALLLIGAHYDSTKPIQIWLIEQGVLIFLDLSLLMAMAFYSVGSYFIIIQSFRIGISLFCIVIVKGHLNNLNYTKKLKSISAV